MDHVAFISECPISMLREYHLLAQHHLLVLPFSSFRCFSPSVVEGLFSWFVSGFEFVLLRCLSVYYITVISVYGHVPALISCVDLNILCLLCCVSFEPRCFPASGGVLMMCSLPSMMWGTCTLPHTPKSL